jgi:hypothetical protein
MPATNTRPISLKTLTAKALARNQPCNQRATREATDEKTVQLSTPKNAPLVAQPRVKKCISDQVQPETTHAPLAHYRVTLADGKMGNLTLGAKDLDEALRLAQLWYRMPSPEYPYGIGVMQVEYLAPVVERPKPRACLQSSSDAAFRKSQIEEWRGSMVSLQTRPRASLSFRWDRGRCPLNRLSVWDSGDDRAGA